MDMLLLSRVQFGLTTSFFLLFPAITLVLGWVLFVLRERFAARGDLVLMQVFRFWAPVHSLAWACAAVAGGVMLVQIDSAWPGLLARMGLPQGVALLAWGLGLTVLSAGCLWAMLAGFGRLPAALHRLATLAVALGGTAGVLALVALHLWIRDWQGMPLPGIGWRDAALWRSGELTLISGLTVGALMAGLAARRWRLGDAGRDVRLTLAVGFGLGLGSAMLLLTTADLQHWLQMAPGGGGLILAVCLAVILCFAWGLVRLSRRQLRLPRRLCAALIGLSFAGWAVMVPAWLAAEPLLSALAAPVQVYMPMQALSPLAELLTYGAVFTLLLALFVLALWRLAREAARDRLAQQVSGRAVGSRPWA